jgi:hypothetical protein
MVTLKKGITFEKGSPASGKKYIAILPDGKRVPFGARGYQHYKDSVPKRLGGGKWSSKDHLDKDRRKNYRSRHAGMRNKDGRRSIDVKYSPAWFSYHFLW